MSEIYWEKKRLAFVVVVAAAVVAVGFLVLAGSLEFGAMLHRRAIVVVWTTGRDLDISG